LIIGVSTCHTAPSLVLPSAEVIFALACARMKYRYAHSSRVYSPSLGSRPEALRPCFRACSLRERPASAVATAVSDMGSCSDLVGPSDAAGPDAWYEDTGSSMTGPRRSRWNGFVSTWQ
jgi:hypothetical protein